MPEMPDQAVEADPRDSSSPGAQTNSSAGGRFFFSLLIHNIIFALALLLAYMVWSGAVNQVLSGHRKQMHAKAVHEEWPEDVKEELRKSAEQDARWFTGLYLLQLPFFLVVKSIIFGRLGLFKGEWHRADIRVLTRILKASWFCLMVFYLIVVVLYYMPRLFGRMSMLPDYGDGVLVLDFMTTVFLVGGARLAIRLYREEFARRRQ